MDSLEQQIKQAQKDLIKLSEEKLKLLADLSKLRVQKISLQQEIDARFATQKEEIARKQIQLNNQQQELQKKINNVDQFFSQSDEWFKKIEDLKTEVAGYEEKIEEKKAEYASVEAPIQERIERMRELERWYTVQLEGYNLQLNTLQNQEERILNAPA